MLQLIFTTFILAVSVSSAQTLRGLVDPKSIETQSYSHDPEGGVDFQSQYQEDRIVYDHFFAQKPKCDGVILAMGGLDGKTFSNSWFFEYGLHWKALLVKALPSKFGKNGKESTRCHQCLGYHVRGCPKCPVPNWNCNCHRWNCRGYD